MRATLKEDPKALLKVVVSQALFVIGMAVCRSTRLASNHLPFGWGCSSLPVMSSGWWVR